MKNRAILVRSFDIFMILTYRLSFLSYVVTCLISLTNDIIVFGESNIKIGVHHRYRKPKKKGHLYLSFTLFPIRKKLKLMNTISQENKCLSIASVVILWALYTRMVSEKKKNTIPVPDSTYPYIGHLCSLGKFPSKTISKWHKKYGPILQMHMGAQTWISVDDPVLAHKIFVTHGVETSFRPHSTYAYYYYSAQGK